MIVRAYIGLGANLGEAANTLQVALQAIGLLPESWLLAASPLYRSAPVGYLDQPDFVNAVACIETTRPPLQLLTDLQALEEQSGRQRTFRNAPRTLDLDLLLYGDCVLNEPDLELPHPRMHQRGFVLVPLLDIAPDIIIPGVGPANRCASLLDLTDLVKLE
ncbi:2-amino-4-hydroxy-6-hydroxymethyldihydropteridine diphosphokinase [Parachitinimonas caeni]|uniref:2-amino-4-hydroxy-6-hydroxymethyldihydropteridine pyrophosphokinase n=1 Tax=Parachitinimonas caeni TaxID=3031301 RepID=A0ABT7DRV7_9NEIS|nr:2-amino-4-hydroxy-6-hydroxymethyldihydropteridine diphosphokinase [Parachitinimonas caeni]MDK2122807.1 2-amino-4-hydroxy-6-hydroxymethyldihydropteridine diphosphokinase [Parachitinimonas caeni]